MSIASQLQRRRRTLGLSQSELAHAAGLSLATVQNVEAGRANPALSTLRTLFAPLGLELEVTAAPADWDALIALGLPLQGDAATLPRRDAETLRQHLGRAALELEAQDGGSARRREGVEALLLALHGHYRSVLRRWLRGAPAVRRLLPSDPTGRHIKLARIARARLAEYL